MICYDLTKLLVAVDLALSVRRAEFRRKYAAGRAGRRSALCPVEAAFCHCNCGPLRDLGGRKEMVWRYGAVSQHVLGLAVHSGSNWSIFKHGPQGLWIQAVSAVIQMLHQQLGHRFFYLHRGDPDSLSCIYIPQVFDELLAKLFLFYRFYRLPFLDA